MWRTRKFALLWAISSLLNRCSCSPMRSVRVKVFFSLVLKVNYLSVISHGFNTTLSAVWYWTPRVLNFAFCLGSKQPSTCCFQQLLLILRYSDASLSLWYSDSRIRPYTLSKLDLVRSQLKSFPGEKTWSGLSLLHRFLHCVQEFLTARRSMEICAC